MEDIRMACRLLSPKAFMGTIDVKDAYFLVPVHKSHRKYLRFLFRNCLYEFTCLPFGLNQAPYIFTKIMKPVVNFLRSHNFLSVIYLDDILCFGNNFDSCKRNLESTVAVLESLGFVLNLRKSSLIPNTSCKFLGFILNSTNLTLSLTPNKREILRKLVQSFQKKNFCRIRDFAKLIGSLVAACPAVEYGTLYCRSLETAEIQALDVNNNNFEARMVLPVSISQDLEWWQQQLPSASRKIRSGNYVREIFSDVSPTGWGAFCEGNRAHGLWKREEQSLHINTLEIMVAGIALRCFASDLIDCEILLRVDNSTAKAYINKLGGTRFSHLHNLAKDIWRWCEERQIWVHAAYIPSRDNSEADHESRITNVDTEWELADYAYKDIVKRFGQPLIDLFASRANAKCAAYCAWERDPDAVAIDALTIKWSDLEFFAFPRFAIMAKQSTPPACSKTFPGCREVIREAYVRRNLPAESLDILIASLTSSTLQQYNSALRDWWTFSQQKSRDPFATSATAVLEFLTYKFNSGASYGTLNSTRSAISLISSEYLSGNAYISRFLKGVFKLRPCKPKYESTWDTAPVLEELAKQHPLETLDLQALTNKTILLLALCTAHRSRTFSLISIDNLTTTPAGIEIKIPEQIKTSRPGAFQPLLILPFFKEKPELCAASAIIRYLKVTKALRGEEKKLFISIRKPYKAVSSQTIGKWIKSMLAECGVDERFTGHSVRHAATSKAASKGISIETIRKTAGWSQNSQVFAKFYQRPISQAASNFAVAVLSE
ncbi:uncharacterized protein LOC130668794 [Microplitis mediator]|uniref:uncharacterized protein LOC130668794 n=1 Tax=Microplitis mediator TaxID=375433 RepID=UPI00255587F9|nr:uncharacterized protein LOC130668794 [Microplitis mediator]